jgi:hypothetical protein
MVLIWGIYFVSMILLAFSSSDSIAMDSCRQPREEYLKIIKELPACQQTKTWPYSHAVFTTKYSTEKIASHPKSNIIATLSFPDQVQVWNMERRELQATYSYDNYKYYPKSIAIDPNKNRVAVFVLKAKYRGPNAYDELYLDIWNADTGTKEKSFYYGEIDDWYRDCEIDPPVQFHDQHDWVMARCDYGHAFSTGYVWDLSSDQRFVMCNQAWGPMNRFAHPEVQQKGRRDIHVVREYKNYTPDQDKLRYALLDWFSRGELDKNIDSLEKLLADVASNSEFTYQGCCAIWQSFPITMRWAWLKNMLEAIERYGKYKDGQFDFG